MNTKSCIHCGREIPKDASFCPYCEESQSETKTIAAPRPKRRRIFCLLTLLLLAAAFAIAVFLYHRPRTYEGGASVVYPLSSGDVTVLVSYDWNSGEDGHSAESRSDRLPPGESAAVPAQLFVWRDGDPSAQAEFLSGLASCTAEAVPEAGMEAMSVNGPNAANTEGPGAAYIADIGYRSDCGTNEIRWELRMKNGDILRLSQSFTCEVLPTAEYHYETTPLSTMEDLAALLDRIPEETDDSAVVTIHLAPVTYEGNLSINDRAVILRGSSDSNGRSRFTGTLTVNTRKPNVMEFYDVNFAGNGSGTGLVAHELVIMENCSFTGFDTAAVAGENAWLAMESCTFENNKVGFRFDSKSASGSADEYHDMTFRGNDIAVQLNRVPGDTPLHFMGCTFEDNGVDFDDPKGLVTVE